MESSGMTRVVWTADAKIYFLKTPWKEDQFMKFAIFSDTHFGKKMDPRLPTQMLTSTELEGWRQLLTEYYLDVSEYPLGGWPNLIHPLFFNRFLKIAGGYGSNKILLIRVLDLM